MNYKDIADREVSVIEKRAYLVDGGTTAITIRIPRNLKDAVADAASLQGLSFSAYVRTCLMDCLLEDQQ